jgi:hypothetical protein
MAMVGSDVEEEIYACLKDCDCQPQKEMEDMLSPWALYVLEGLLSFS